MLFRSNDNDNDNYNNGDDSEVGRPIDSVLKQVESINAKDESEDILSRIDEKINTNNINVEIIENGDDDDSTDLDDIKALVSNTLQSKMQDNEEVSQEA